MPIRSQMGLITGQIDLEYPELFALKFGQNLFDHKISDEFDYGSNQTRPARVICP